MTIQRKKTVTASRPRPKLSQVDCAVIGGGPGGLVAALYLRRFGRKTVLINSGKPRASWGTKVHNLIGYDRGISGKSLLRRLERQISQIGGLIRISGKAEISRSGAAFEVKIANQRFLAKKVILATGISDVHPDLPNLTELRDLGFLKYCSICDGYELRNNPVAVLAKDDFGIKKALFIANWTKNIRVLIPTDFEPTLTRLKELSAVGAKLIRCRTLKILPRPEHDGVLLNINNRRSITASAVYVELGCTVNDSAFRSLRKLRRTDEGFIITTTEQKTSVPGLFAVGDCVNLLGQISVASGQAAVAATTIHNELL